MEKLSLVEEGIFPIVLDKAGQPLCDRPKTGFDIPGTVQGEGKLAGLPSLFVRLASCNLRCMWQLPNGMVSKCDTAYASFHVGKVVEWDIDDIIAVIAHNLKGIGHVVISGGEPLLQAAALAVLCKRLKEKTGVHITIESNATLFDERVAENVDLISLSPKLSNSSPSDKKMEMLGLTASGPFVYHAERRRNIVVVQKWVDAMRRQGTDFQLKFVVSDESEAKEIQHDFLSHLANIKPSDVLVMPLGANMDELSLTSSHVLPLAIANGWRYSPRIHIELFGCKQGV